SERKIGHFTDAPAVLEFVNSQDLKALAALGTSCPDHFLRTKIRPLVLRYDPTSRNLGATLAALDETLASYRADYAAYYQRCKHADSPAMRDPNAVIYLVPAVGMLSFAKDKSTARIASEFYVTPSTGWVDRPAAASTWAFRSRKRSISNIGCLKRRSCSACRSRNRLR